MNISVTPVPAPRMTKRDRWARRPAVIRYFKYRDDIRAAWGGREVPAELRLVFVMPMPKSWSNKKRLLMDGKPHQQKPDVDNMIKAVLDALCEEDRFIYDVHATKIWGENGTLSVETLKGEDQKLRPDWVKI